MGDEHWATLPSALSGNSPREGRLDHLMDKNVAGGLAIKKIFWAKYYWLNKHQWQSTIYQKIKIQSDWLYKKEFVFKVPNYKTTTKK